MENIKLLTVTSTSEHNQQMSYYELTPTGVLQEAGPPSSLLWVKIQTSTD